jgi:hypothetical protein
MVVIRIERIDGSDEGYDRVEDAVLRSRRVIQLDLKAPEAKAIVRRLTGSADALVEGYRPGVMERLGLGGRANGTMRAAPTCWIAARISTIAMRRRTVCIMRSARSSRLSLCRAA